MAIAIITIKKIRYASTKWSSPRKRTYRYSSKDELRVCSYWRGEEPVDIHAVMKEIKELEAKRADLDKEIEGYLKELGII